MICLEDHTVRKNSRRNSCYLDFLGLTASGLLLENVVTKFRAKILPEARSDKQRDLKALLFPHCIATAKEAL